MKPLKLTIKNIASFTGEHAIDFSLLGNMFLICGKTGSGKTTVLDSLTYALYGSLPGSRKQNEIRSLRSDFCGPQEECFVELDFMLNGKTYRVRRTLPVDRITRNGTVAANAEEVELYRLDGTEAELMSRQKSEADSLIQSLISLSADEFSRIILLPQGDFAEFLRQKSSERKIVLSKLFPIERFTRTAERLKEKRNNLSSMLEEVMGNLQRLEQAFPGSQAGERIREYENEAKKASKNCEKLRALLFDIQTETRGLEEKIGLHGDYEAAVKELEKLLSHADKQKTDEENLSQLREAVRIEPFLDAAEQAQAKRNRIQKDSADVQSQLENLARIKTDSESRRDEYERFRERIPELSSRIQNAELALGAAEELRTAEQRLCGIENRIQNESAAIQSITEKLEPLQKIAQNEESLREAGEAAERELFAAEYLHLKALEKDAHKTESDLQKTAENARIILNGFSEEREHIRKTSGAYFLAQNLEEGKPCPVCGSLHHPHPAESEKQTLGLEEKIRTQQSLCEQAERSLRKAQDDKKELQGRIAQSRENLARFTEDFIAECEKEAENIDTASAAERQKTARQKHEKQAAAYTEFEKACTLIREYEAALKIPQEKLRELEKDKAAAQAAFEHSEKQLADLLSRIQADIPQSGQAAAEAGQRAQAVQNIVTSLRGEKERLENAVRAYDEQCARTEKAIAELTGKAAVLKSELNSSEKENDSCRAVLYEAVENSVFVSAARDITERIERIRAVLQNKACINELERKIENYKNEKQRLEILCGEKKALLSGSLEEMQAARERLSAQKNETEKDLGESENALADIRTKLSDAKAKAGEYEHLEKRRKELFAELADYEKIYNAVSGKNPKKIQLESWILQMYLEEVCLYAAKRLERISDGRYTMYVKDADGGRGYRGLDLEIYDSYTGKRRACSTLSGGETFMASISLALAVSDTVQAKNGGVQLDSLFIDEGFGSLDDTALEKALSVLDEIRGSRCIGLVSHVASLKTRIGARLEIEKGLTGSRIKTVQG